MEEFVVSVKVTAQVTEDQWAYLNNTLKVTEETTIGEIKDWYRKLKPVDAIEFMVTGLQVLTKIEQPNDDLPY